MPAGSTIVNINTQTTTVCKGGAGPTITGTVVNGSPVVTALSDVTGLVPGMFLTNANITTGTFVVGANVPVLIAQFLGDLTSGSATIANVVPTLPGLGNPVGPAWPPLGYVITGSNVAAGATLIAQAANTNAGQTLTMSANASGTQAGVLIKVWSFNPALASLTLSANATGSATATSLAMFTASPGILYGIDINTPVATSVITVFDGPVAGGTVVGKLTVPASPVMPLQWLKNTNGILLNRGLTILTATASSDLSVEFS